MRKVFKVFFLAPLYIIFMPFICLSKFCLLLGKSKKSSSYKKHKSHEKSDFLADDLDWIDKLEEIDIALEDD